MASTLTRCLVLVGMLGTGATDSWAQGSTVLFSASPKISCFGMDEDTYKLVKHTYAGADAIAWLLATSTATASAWELVYYQEYRAFLVIDRCNETLVDETAGATVCTPDSKVAKQHRSCMYEFVDSATRSRGQMICDQTESFASDPARNKMSATCRGEIEVFGFPCQIEIKISKMHNTKGC